MYRHSFIIREDSDGQDLEGNFSKGGKLMNDYNKPKTWQIVIGLFVVILCCLFAAATFGLKFAEPFVKALGG